MTRSPVRTAALWSALAGTCLIITTAATHAAAAPRSAQAACGWNNPGTEHPFYEHCDPGTDVWIQVTRTFIRGDYHRCVGYGKTVLDSDATGAWYDSTYRGGLCNHPGDTGP